MDESTPGRRWDIIRTMECMQHTRYGSLAETFIEILILSRQALLTVYYDARNSECANVDASYRFKRVVLLRNGTSYGAQTFFRGSPISMLHVAEFALSAANSAMRRHNTGFNRCDASIQCAQGCSYFTFTPHGSQSVFFHFRSQRGCRYSKQSGSLGFVAFTFFQHG